MWDFRRTPYFLEATMSPPRPHDAHLSFLFSGKYIFGANIDLISVEHYLSYGEAIELIEGS